GRAHRKDRFDVSACGSLRDPTMARNVSGSADTIVPCARRTRSDGRAQIDDRAAAGLAGTYARTSRTFDPLVHGMTQDMARHSSDAIPTASATSIDSRPYLLERVDDAAVVQLYADGFAALPLREKMLIWHLYLAAL